MKGLWTNRKAGGYILIVSILLQIVSVMNYWTWTSGQNPMDPIVMGGLCLGTVAGIAAFCLSSDFLLVVNTALCSCGALQLAVQSAGSFADWYQGIVMFGDASQVPRILAICAMALIAIVLLIVTGFMGSGKKTV